METARPATLYLLCGKIAAGKSTLACQLAARPDQVDEGTYDLFMSYFVLPTADEGFNVIVHTS
jgi:hypothetical protein